MSKRNWRWLAGCGIGCGAVLVLGIVGIVGGSFVMMKDFKESITVRETLDERHGEQADFTPPGDGAVAPERMEAFLTVRENVMELCDEFTATAGKFAHLDELDDDTPKTEALSDVMKLTGDVFMMMPRLGRFFQARNGSLLEVDMGLGEYTYIYVLVYRDRLPDEEPGDRICAALRQMLRNQLAGSDDIAMSAVLEAEIARLEADPRSIPWQVGLPAVTAASIEPYRERLDAVFCPATVGLEFNKNRQRGLSIHGN